MPPPPVPSRALTLHSTARASNSATHDVVDLTKPRPRTQEPSAAPSRKRSYSTFSIKTERSLSPTPSVKRERGERSESEWTVTPRRTPAVPPPRAPSHTRMPFRHASSVSTVGLNPPRPRVSRKNTESSSGGLGGQPAPEDLRHAVSQVRNKLETFGVLSDGEAGPALAALLGRLYDRSHLADESGKPRAKLTLGESMSADNRRCGRGIARDPLLRHAPGPEHGSFASRHVLVHHQNRPQSANLYQGTKHGCSHA